MTYHRVCFRVKQRVSLVEQKLLTLPELLGSSRVSSEVRVALYLVFCVVFCLSVSVLFLLAIVLSVFLWYYTFGIVKLLLYYDEKYKQLGYECCISNVQINRVFFSSDFVEVLVYTIYWFCLWCLTPLSTIFSYIVAVYIIGGGNRSIQRKNHREQFHEDDVCLPVQIELLTCGISIVIYMYIHRVYRTI